MATPTSDALKFYFASKYLASDGGTVTQQTADAGCTIRTIVDSALTEADDYWNGAVGWFDAATTTAALQGIFFHVRDFDAATDTLTLAKALPAAPAAGDTYRLILGGNYRGDIECYGQTLDGDQPELVTVSGTNITGLTITYASAALLSGTLSVSYNDTAETMEIKMDSESYGVPIDVSGDVLGGVIYDELEEGFIIVNVTNASLPASNQVDTFTVAYPDEKFVPDYQAYETTADKTRYRLLVVRNEDGTDSMTDLTVWCAKPDGDNTTVATGETIGIAASSGDLTDASTHPSGSYWLYNSTLDDLRYVKTRVGNTIYWADATGGHRGKTAQSWAAGNTVVVYPDFDIGIDAPSTNQFENPTDETTAPSGITFSAPMDFDNGLSIGTLANNGVYGVWYRESIVENHRPRSGIIFDTLYQWS